MLCALNNACLLCFFSRLVSFFCLSHLKLARMSIHVSYFYESISILNKIYSLQRASSFLNYIRSLYSFVGIVRWSLLNEDIDGDSEIEQCSHCIVKNLLIFFFNFENRKFFREKSIVQVYHTVYFGPKDGSILQQNIHNLLPSTFWFDRACRACYLCVLPPARL